MKFIILISSLFLINFISCSKSETIIDWGIKNNLEISPLIELSSEKDSIKFIAKEDIDDKKELLKIPYTMMLDVEKSLNLINMNELKVQYEQFKKLDIKTYQPFHVNLQKEEIFLSYLIYLVQHEPQYEKTKLYEQFNLYLSSIKSNIPRSPLLYTSDQIEYLSGTFLGKTLNKVKQLFLDETKVFKNESYYNKDLDIKNYTEIRLFSEKEGVEIMRKIHLVPFFNFFKKDHMRYNAKFIVEKNGDIKISSKKKIKKGDEIIINGPRRTNVERLIFEGESNPHYVNYRENYIIPAFSPGLYYKYDIDDINLYQTHFINLVEKEFDERALYIYRNYSKLFNADDGDAWAYGVLLENIEYYKKYVDSFNSTRINELFENTEDRMNLEKAFKGESKILEKAYTYIKNKYEGLKNIEAEKKNKNNNKNNKNTDL